MDNSMNTLIYSYTRADAIEDGVLIDVSKTAKEAGIKFHTVVTDNLYHSYIVPALELTKIGQSIEGRLWDVLMVFRYYAAQEEGDEIFFPVDFLTEESESKKLGSKTVRIKALKHPGNIPDPVITLMLPGNI